MYIYICSKSVVNHAVGVNARGKENTDTRNGEIRTIKRRDRKFTVFIIIIIFVVFTLSLLINRPRKRIPNQLQLSMNLHVTQFCGNVSSKKTNKTGDDFSGLYLD